VLSMYFQHAYRALKGASDAAGFKIRFREECRFDSDRTHYLLDFPRQVTG
jgi:hypothetical protein